VRPVPSRYALADPTAATKTALLVTAGDNPDCLRSEGAFAQLCGVAPLPASSGRTDRHRLNRGGDRGANNALYTVVLSRLRHHGPPQDYARRRRAQGLSAREIIRCLKRYVAREIHRHLVAVLDTPRSIIENSPTVTVDFEGTLTLWPAHRAANR
jgi:transposase